MVRKYTLLILLLTGFITSNARDKEHALGVRGGINSGFEYRHYLSSANSLKLLLSTRDKGIQLHGLYEQHANDVFDFSRRLTLVYGGGIHAGYESWNRSYYIGHTRYTERVARPLAGIDLLAGLEYPFLILPFSVGFEVKPYVDFWGKNYIRIQPFDFAFTIKFHFN
jgi:hypothetical protein